MFLLNPYRYTSGAGAFSAAVMADTPWAWWKLDESSSAIAAADASGNGRSLNTYNVDGAKRQQTPLTADGGYSVLADANSITGALTGFSGQTALSLEIMVKPVSLTAARVLMHNGDLSVSGGNQGQFLAINTAGGIYFQTFASGSFRVLASDDGAITAGEAAIVGIAHDPDADTLTIYKNGTAIKTLSYTLGLSDAANANWTLGNLNPESNSATSYLDNALVFASALPAARWLAHAQAAGFA